MNAKISNETFNQSASGTLLTSEPLTILFLPALCVCLVGVPGSVVSICFYAKQIRNSNRATVSLLIALAVYDMLSLLTTIPYISLAIHMEFVDPVLGTYYVFCHGYLLHYLVRVPKYSSNILLMIIAIERLCGAIKPHKVKQIFTKKSGIVCIVVVSAVIPLLLLPRAFEYTCVPVFGERNQITSYTYMFSNIGQNRSGYKYFYIVITVLLYSVPLAVISICNIALITFLCYRAYSKRSVLPLSLDHTREMKTTKLILVITCTFVICVSPLGIMFQTRGINNITITYSVYRAVIPVALFLENINYSINAVIYYAGSARFRTFVKHICKVNCKSSRVTPASSRNNDNVELRSY